MTLLGITNKRLTNGKKWPREGKWIFPQAAQPTRPPCGAPMCCIALPLLSGLASVGPMTPLETHGGAPGMLRHPVETPSLKYWNDWNT